MFAGTLKKLGFVFSVLILTAVSSFTGAHAAEQAPAKAFLEITMIIPEANRSGAVKVYTDYRGPFLKEITGAVSKELLVRSEDVQVLHGFQSVEDAKAYLNSKMFNDDVFVGLKGLWTTDPDVRIYTVF